MNTGSSIYSTWRFCWYYSNYWELHALSLSFLRSWLAIALHPWIRSSLSLRYMGASKQVHIHTRAMQWGSLRLAPIITRNLTIRLLPLHLFRFVLLPLHLFGSGCCLSTSSGSGCCLSTSFVSGCCLSTSFGSGCCLLFSFLGALTDSDKSIRVPFFSFAKWTNALLNLPVTVGSFQ